ncbi:MAG: winged helix-turn-helix transcriptional regulator [Methanosarcinales archaeon]|nr:winged helix-turn-helix transcriptional regulator [Methanosarcinales archaeon]
MENIDESSIQDLLKWVISVDRRLILMEAMKKHNVVKASDIAHETGRSTQNISHALKELEDKQLVECLTPGKNTWKKYILTDLGKELLKELDGKFF